VKGTIHWVSVTHALAAQVRLYDRLFRTPSPGSADDVMAELNPDSLETVDARFESNLGDATAGDVFQFERLGYFCPDSIDHNADKPVFNRVVTLRDGWAKIERQALQGK
jgi:glutaminyl-tRNA synthetase